ncbi:MAG: alpha/beta fold hydrolase, partial [Acidimicrobiia bacterium]
QLRSDRLAGARVIYNIQLHGQVISTTVGDLEVRVLGEASARPTALLWHSLFVDSRSWHRVEDDLAEDRRLVLVTGPGHGDSTDPGRRYTMEECADAAMSILDHLGIEGPVDWVGNAWGGHVGLIAAVKHSARLRSLVTAGTPVHSYSGSGRIQTLLLLMVYRMFGPRRFLVDSVIEVLLSERTRSNDPAAVALTRDSFVGLVDSPMLWRRSHSVDRTSRHCCPR